MRHRTSLLSILGIAVLVVLWSVLKMEHYHQAISWDAFGYYLYLPAIFLHADMAIKDPSWFHALFEVYSPSDTIYQVNYMDDGGWAIKYPIGLAILWAPFFAVGHVVAGLVGAAQDGLSRPYQWALLSAAWCTFILGLHWLRKLLSGHFTDAVITITLLLLFLGTNLLYMVVFNPLMPHVFLFGLYAGILRHTALWHQRPAFRTAAILGLLMGLAVATRHTEAIALLIPLLWGIWEGPVSSQLRKLWEQRLQLLVMASVLMLVMLPQLLYWKTVTGQWFYQGYTNAGEGLDLARPHLAEVLFSYRKGLLLYTPLIVLAFAGLLHVRRYMRPATPAVALYLLLNLWIVASWTIWWYPDSYGNRAFVQSYAALAIPLAALLQWAMERRRVALLIPATFVLLAVLNLFQTWQAIAGILHPSRMTRDAYWAIFARTERPQHLDELLLVQRDYDGSVAAPDLERYRLVAVDEQSFEQVIPGYPEDHFTDPVMHSGTASYRLDADVSWSSALGRAYGSMTRADHLYARYTLHWFIPEDSPTPDCVAVIAMEHEGRQYGGHMVELGSQELVPGRWNKVEVWYLTPTIRHPDDVMRAYLWLRDGTPLWVDDTRLEVHEPLRDR
jgi:hypothetical protein